MLGTCATFSATAPLARTKKGGGRRGGAKVKNNGAAAVARKKVVLIRAIYKPNFALKKFIKIATGTSWMIKIPSSYNLKHLKA